MEHNSTDEKINFYALLIGIDCYLPNKMPDGGCYPSLGGCVRDILQVEAFLQNSLELSNDHIIKLTATNQKAMEPKEPCSRWPTYENIVTAFKDITNIANQGDQVYIHYSGHGGRATTAYPELKGKNGLDEVIVPTDIGNSKARYIRDVEIAYLLQTMVDKGLIVTLVLDCCHSGGATRGSGKAVKRGMHGSSTGIDNQFRQTKSLVASTRELIKTWRTLSDGGTKRKIEVGSGWLLEPKGYVLMAACRASEIAHEYPFDDHGSNGALTYWMLDSLRQIGPRLTYKTLHERILAKVHTQFEEQTPQLQGEGNRTLFGSNEIRPFYAVLVMDVDRQGENVTLAAGQTHGLRKGALFAIYPRRTCELTQASKCLALVEIIELGAVNSLAKFRKKFNEGEIEQGALAVPMDSGNIRLQRNVRLLVEKKDIRSQLKTTIDEAGRGWLHLSTEDEPADFQVMINESNQYEIWDSAGKLINLRPVINFEDEGAGLRLVQRLIHLTKYRGIQELDNNDANSPLAHKLFIELEGWQSDYDPADGPEPKPFLDPGNTPIVKVGEWTFLRIRNDQSPGKTNDPSRILNITVLDMQPDWGITQIYPSGAGYFEPLDPGREICLPLKASLPDDYKEGKDVIKVFATLETTNFRWLELPSLDKNIKEKNKDQTNRGTLGSPLERFLAAIALETPKTRDLDLPSSPSNGWITAQVEVRIESI
jgi:hypothetical protein